MACAISTDMYGRFLSFSGGGAFFFAGEDEDAPVSVFFNGQRLVMVAVDGGGGCSCFGCGRVYTSYKR
jgi:hypothetical protein